MEPRQQGLSGGVENVPMPPNGYELHATPETVLHNNEIPQERPVEAGVAQAEAVQVAMPALPTPILATPSVTTQLVADDNMPITANDDDLIEKEWVDKAKKIIADTRDDPYRREREISKLQIEYIRRRYGREIGDSGD